MGRCKYLLPCGRCDKRGAHCDASDANLESHNTLKAPSEPTPTEHKYDPNCNHDWFYESTTYTNPDLSLTYNSYTTYRCSKCEVRKFVYNFKT